MFFEGVSLDYEEQGVLELPDGDVLELAFSPGVSSDYVILTHGFEGDVARPYMLGMAKAALAQGYGVLAWNMRGLW